MCTPVCAFAILGIAVIYATIRRGTDTLNKVENQVPHLTVNYPMHRDPNKGDDIGRRPPINAQV
jgi:hypothetical protein